MAVGLKEYAVWSADIERVYGDIAAARPVPDWTAAEAAYRSGLAIARRQGAALLACRVGVSLARLLRLVDRPREGYELLESCLERLPEGGDLAIIPAFPTNKKESDIRNPPPSKAFVFIDERNDSIDDGYFAITLSPPSWQNLPASWHSTGDVLSFADGHAEHWRWLETTTVKDFFPFGALTKPTDRDFNRVQAAYASKEY